MSLGIDYLNALLEEERDKGVYRCKREMYNSGKLLKVKDPAEAGYPDGFNCEGSHDLMRVARCESYRGFLFGSLEADVKPLTAHLGESAKIIDMIVDQSPDGLQRRAAAQEPCSGTAARQGISAPQPP